MLDVISDVVLKSDFQEHRREMVDAKNFRRKKYMESSW